MHESLWTSWDYLFAGIIIISTVFAAIKGFMREIISLIALIGGFILAVRYYQVLGARLLEFSRTETIADLAGFLFIFLGCLLIGAAASWLINRFLKAVSLKWIDRLLGGIFGILRGWAICSVLVLGLIAFPIRENFMSSSFLAPCLLAGAKGASLLLPQGLKDKFNQEYNKVLHRWNHSQKVS